MAADRDARHHTLHKAASQFEENRRDSLKEKRQTMKAQVDTSTTENPDLTYMCQHCKRTCLSRIGLLSHERACSRRGQQPWWSSFVKPSQTVSTISNHSPNFGWIFHFGFVGSFLALWNFGQNNSEFQATRLLERWHLGDLTINHLGCLTHLQTTKVARTLNLKGSLCKIIRVGMKLVCPREDTILCYQTTKREVCTVSVV